MASWKILQGDVREQLGRLPAGYAQCVVTSPPYWGLRDYGTASWEGGDPACDHQHETKHQQQGASSQRKGRSNVEAQRNQNFRDVCGKCGAARVDEQIGLEPTPDLYVQHLVEVFRAVRRVLKDDGTVWLNLGDCYQSGSRGGYDRERAGVSKNGGQNASDFAHAPNRLPQQGLKDKDLVGIPWRVAFALQADGWYLRSDIIWAKAHEFCPGGVGSTMPLGGKRADRPTPAHEYLFLLSKSPRYFYDEEAVKQPGVYPAGTRAAKGSGTREGNRRGSKQQQSGRLYSGFNDRYFAPEQDDGYAVYTGKRRLRDVWFISPQPYKEAHFATFPEKLVEPCILAGCPAGGVVLDPFCGSGRAGIVATRLDRHFLGIDLKLEYCAMARGAIRAAVPQAQEV